MPGRTARRPGPWSRDDHPVPSSRGARTVASPGLCRVSGCDVTTAIRREERLGDASSDVQGTDAGPSHARSPPCEAKSYATSEPRFVVHRRAGRAMPVSVTCRPPCRAGLQTGMPVV
jgi:hypothetical protein